MNTTVGLEFSVDSSKSSDESLVFKGPGTTYIDVSGAFKDALDHLHAKYNVKLESLGVDDRKSLALIMGYVEEMEKTKNYDLAYNIIADKFKDAETPLHGTVGEYLAGSVKDKQGNPCFLHRVLSIRKPGECCNETVIEGTKSSDSCGDITFRKVNNGKGKGKTTVYVPYTSKDDFPGFSDAEKSSLRLLTKDKIRIIGYSQKHQYYFAITDVPVSICDVPDKRKCSETVSSTKWWILIIVIAIIVLLALYYYCYSTKM